MESLYVIPGATTAGDAITITTGAPDIDAVIAAQLERLPVALADHPAADVVATLNDHTGANVRDALADHAAADIVDALADHSAALMAASFDNHTQAEVVNAILDHVVHAHDLQVQAGASVEAFGATGAGVANLVSNSGQTIPGGVGATGIQDNAAAQAHGNGVGPLVHGGAVDLIHAVGATPPPHTAGINPLAHTATATDFSHVGASPDVAAVPTRSTTRIITLDVNTLLGDIVALFYYAVGERVAAS